MHFTQLIRIAKVIFRIPMLALELFWAFLSLYLIVAYLGMGIQVGDDYQPPKEGVTIYLRTDGIHTDFLMPAENELHRWKTVFPFADFKGKDSTWFTHLSVGWGDQGFFLNTPEWSDLKFSTAFDALFYRGKSALHTMYQAEPTVSKLCVKLKISNADYRKLVHYIKASAQLNPNGTAICIPNRGYHEYDAFYEATEKYSLFSTCNSWINGGLKSSNLPACLWTPLSFAIMAKYEK